MFDRLYAGLFPSSPHPLNGRRVTLCRCLCSFFLSRSTSNAFRLTARSSYAWRSSRTDSNIASLAIWSPLNVPEARSSQTVRSNVCDMSTRNRRIWSANVSGERVWIKRVRGGKLNKRPTSSNLFKNENNNKMPEYVQEKNF